MARSVFATLIALLLAAAPARSAEDSAWTSTLDRISSGVVSIRVDSTRAFDTEWNSSSQATGFVVDAERGLILTNRHVVTPGPVVAEAVFRNNEEVRLMPVYRDPVHDFGFFRYDPEALRYIEPTELPLRPDGAGIGREIRVIGNDAGEQLVNSCGHDRASRPQGTRLRTRQVQRLQYLLSASGVRHVGRFVRFAGRQYRGRGRRSERGREQLGSQQFFPAARSY